VSSSVHNLTQQYAVISVRSKPRPERTVVAYLDEKTLRDLLAEPSIVSLGYHSREEAIASLDGSAPIGHGLPANLAAASVEMADRSLDECGMTQPQFQRGFHLAKHREFVCGLLKNSFTTAISIFYSKNLLCMAIRTVISG
jgi:hypothetical protein